MTWPAQAEPASSGVDAPGAGDAPPTQAKPAQPVQPKRPVHYLCAELIARIYEVFPLLCPMRRAVSASRSPKSMTNWVSPKSRTLTANLANIC